MIATLINFAIFVSVLYFSLRDPIKQMVRERHRVIKEDVETTRVRLREAKDRYEEFSAKLKAVDAELEAVRAQGRKDAEAVKTRIVSSARSLSGAIVSDAKTNAAGLVTDLQRDLKSEFGAKIIEKAEALVVAKLTGDVRARIRKEFSSQMASVSQMESVG